MRRTRVRNTVLLRFPRDFASNGLMARRAVHPVDSFELAKWRLASTRIDEEGKRTAFSVYRRARYVCSPVR